MVTPLLYLPPALSESAIRHLLTSIHLPSPTSIKPLQVAAAYHTIYLINFPADVAPHLTPAEAREEDGSMTLVLRVSGRHLPRIKTLNEVAVMKWVRDNTSIRTPAIVRYDTSEANPIGHEFTLLEKIPGVSADKVYAAVSEDVKHAWVRTLTDYLEELHAQPWSQISGLSVAADGETVVPGRVLEETFWQAPDVEKYWSGVGDRTETIDTLNIHGPYDGYAAWTLAQLDSFCYAIKTHPALASQRDLLLRLEAFGKAIKSHAADLDKVKLVLAHRDLHFGNIMVDPDHPEIITGILDWEFAGVFPANRWDPVRAFLWNASEEDGSYAEKYRLRAVFEEMCKHDGDAGKVNILEDAKTTELQDAMQQLSSHLRAIVEVVSRGKDAEIDLHKVPGWRKVIDECMNKMGV